ncbi:hypothetical protein [Paenibacillus sp. LHD-38]|uniref:hypothetical protein n=1 Tax=Paenibacillus sp. LHD-38 TaxID=3072143 RepID=UPI00280C6A87|nr:hypothetical protein [Paenibacillus sp. LHD-38]MDQ8739260.1 hypothetical protein [Paenibacillus sp. LHD-38]
MDIRVIKCADDYNAAEKMYPANEIVFLSSILFEMKQLHRKKPPRNKVRCGEVNLNEKSFLLLHQVSSIALNCTLQCIDIPKVHRLMKNKKVQQLTNGSSS